jgi:putative oxidoreductase
MMTGNMDAGLLILRIVVGLLFVGHGSQKLFGWFGGKGMKGHAGLIEKTGMRPTYLWAWVSALGEFLGGWGLAAGLLTPLAATALIGSMLVVIFRVSWPKGMWNTNGGIEWPLVLATVAFVIGLTGPGAYSLDQALRLTLPEPLTYVVVLIAMLVVVIGAMATSAAASQRERRTA